jgi:hypothetical protein
MSTLVAQTISNGTVSTSSENVIRGSARAWVRFNNGTINSSYNVSSVTRNTTGYYTVNYTSALANSDYAALATAGPIGNGTGNYISGPTISNGNGSTTYTASTTQLSVLTAALGQNGGADASYVAVAVFSS